MIQVSSHTGKAMTSLLSTTYVYKGLPTVRIGGCCSRLGLMKSSFLDDLDIEPTSISAAAGQVVPLSITEQPDVPYTPPSQPTGFAEDVPHLDPHMLNLSELGDNVQQFVDSVSGALPEPFQAVVSTLGGDVAQILSLHFSVGAIGHLFAIYYLFFTRPSPISAVLDFYILAPLSKAISPTFSENDFTLRDRLGNGNYGQGWYDAVLISNI